MNNRTKSAIRSLGCRVIDEHNIDCHGTNIQVIRLPKKDMGKHRIRSFCGSQSIEIENNIRSDDETRLIYDAMKHQLKCKAERDRYIFEAKSKGLKAPDEYKGGGIVGDIAKSIGSNIWKTIKPKGDTVAKGRAELEGMEKAMREQAQAEQKIAAEKLKGKLSDILKKPKPDLMKMVKPKPAVDASSGSFSIDYVSPFGG